MGPQIPRQEDRALRVEQSILSNHDSPAALILPETALLTETSRSVLFWRIRTT
jgi:hypothetical protein